MKFIEGYSRLREIQDLREILAKIELGEEPCNDIWKKRYEDRLKQLERVQLNFEDYIVVFSPALTLEQRSLCHSWIKENLQEDWVYLDEYLANFNNKADKKKFQAWYALAII